MIRGLVTTLFAIIGLGAAVAGDPAGEADGVLKPIIAGLHAAPGEFAGRTIAIYGVVVERSGAGSEFMLQDVSQHPLRVVGPADSATAIGDQLMVVGTLHSDAGEPYLLATGVTRVRVLGGGGCC